MPLIPKISIVIPSYNQGKYLEETLVSVIDQRYPNLQLIVIDGGSVDNSVAIIKQYEKHIHYWVSEKDNGQSHAINKGFAIADGDLLTYLNSDDLLMPNVLEAIANVYCKDKNQIITGNWLEGSNKQTAMLREVIQPPTIENLILNIGLFGQPGTFWSKSEQPILINEQYHFCLDLELFYRLLSSGYKVELINKPVAFFRVHASAKTANLQQTKYEEIIRFLTQCLDKHLNIATKIKALIARNKRTAYRLELAETLKKQPINLIPKLWKAFIYDPRIFIKGI
ncbi:glycosyltransferase family 2 protein [Pedobacter xixiisoli]|uniref:Glycosyltransferase involved in cell wall bisynthesis n=1 Tax=Pedobacter xixiisoli TaxID=1476464 RepID=A0A286A9T4_9SPHI|nr:glycosyltransferase family 2 protein [Pedobacter xixiisoli]SOD18664.1 Glycosyltransferase involved in cell wall bisynthesis [Pedobacter xixiisoli]